LNNEDINRVIYIRDLGVIYNDKFNFINHINSIISKANKVLGFILRSTKDFRKYQTLIYLYKTLVIPILTYCSPIWSPNYDIYINSLNSIQHKFLRRVAFLMGTPMSFDEHDYSQISTAVSLRSIDSLHRYYDLIIVFKSINGLFLSNDLFNIFKFRDTLYNVRNPRCLVENISTSNCLFFASTNRLIRNWNLLPSDIRFLDNIFSFKNKLKERLYTFC